MHFIRVLLSRCAALFGAAKLDQDLNEEISSHLELFKEEALKRGLSEEEAQHAALREFGGVTRVRELYRDERGLPWLDDLSRDLRYALRTLRKSPGFTLVVLLTLALGIGGNTAIFSIVNGVLLNPLPFPNPDRLVTLHESKPNFENGSISFPNFLDWRSQNHAFASMAIARRVGLTLTGKGDGEQVKGSFLSAGFFSVLGVSPLLGREFTQQEELPGATPVALISEGLWRRKFNGDSRVLGQAATLNGKNFTIVGVIPAALHLRISGFSDQDVYAPIGQWENSALMKRGAGLGIHGIGRLKPGVTVEQARGDMKQVTGNLARAFPDIDRGIGASVIPLREEIVGDARLFLLVLMAAVGFVLLIACVNVASLLLARSAGRSREFALRAALGASRTSMVQQLLTESMFLGVTAGALALLPAFWGTQAALKVLPAALPRANEIGLDFHLLAFTTIVSLFTGALFGLAPALKTSQIDPHVALKEGGRTNSGTPHRLLRAFVVLEMAVTLVLLIASGLMIRSLSQLWNVPPGFNPHNVLMFGMSLPPSMANASPAQVRSTIRAIEDKLSSLPGVKALSPVWGAVPMEEDDEQLFWLDGQPKPANEQNMSWAIDYIVQPDYLKVMQIPLKRGRFLAEQDGEHAPLVAVIDEVFARKFFPSQEPIGKIIHLNNGNRNPQIVGVVGHVKQWGLDLDDTNSLRAQIYLAGMQMPDDYFSGGGGSVFLLRYAGNLTAVLDAVRRANRQMSAEQAVYGDHTMDTVISDSAASRRFAMILLASFAALALALACVGIYGVMAYAVSQRTKEVGIRMALGARRRDVLLLVLREGLGLALIGVCAGIAGALALTRLMSGLLFQVSPTDPGVLGAVSLLLVAFAMAACLIPAYRSASTDAMHALRTE